MRSIFTSALVLWFISVSVASGQSPVIDGVFDEWTPTSQIATDPSGDNNGAFDVTTVSAATDGSVVFLHFDIGRVINLQNGEKSDGTLQLNLAANDKSLEIDFRKRTCINEAGDRVGWSSIGFQCLPTYAANKYEVRVDLTSLDAKAGDKVALQFAGSDSLDQPVTISMQQPVQPSSDPTNWTKSPGSFRIVNQNTLRNGLADPERQEKFERLFAAVDADVYCFQEEWERADFMTGVGKTVPRVGSVFVLWNGGCAIATTHKLAGLPMKLDRAVAGLVTIADGKSVVVISVHSKCCGYAGGKEDNLRIQQAEQLVGELKRMRDGAFGETAESAPVVLIGDYNMVGSRKPLDLINAAGLQDVICRATDGSAATWRGLKPDSSFWPGRLDLVSTDGFQSVNGRVFDSSRLSEPELEQLSIEPSDSAASDHLMLVVDCDEGG